MVGDETKKQLITELEKNGNVYVACLKAGINRATFYRWKNGNNEFKKEAGRAERNGRRNNCDIAELSLMTKVKEKDLGAIKYVLSHNSPVYMPKKSDKGNTVIVHKKVYSQETDAEVVRRVEKSKNEKLAEYCDKMEKMYEETGELPVPPYSAGAPTEYEKRVRAYVTQWNEDYS